MSFKTINPTYFLHGLGLNVWELSLIEHFYPVPPYMAIFEDFATQRGWILTSSVNDENDLFNTYTIPGYQEFLFLKWSKNSGNTEIIRSSLYGFSMYYAQIDDIFINKKHRLLRFQNVVSYDEFFSSIINNLSSYVTSRTVTSRTAKAVFV